MTPAAFAKRIDALLPQLDAFLSGEVETIAQLGLATAQDRIVETGRDAEGDPFKPYTPEYEKKKRGATGGKASKKKKAERRTAKASAETPVGKYRGFVDFQFTTRMWQNIGVVEQVDAEGRYRVRVGGRTDETRLKMEGNDLHRPGWFRLSKEEIDQLRAGSKERVTAFVDKFLTQ